MLETEWLLEKPVGNSRVIAASLIYPISGSGEAGRIYNYLTGGETEARDGARWEKTR